MTETLIIAGITILYLFYRVYNLSIEKAALNTRIEELTNEQNSRFENSLSEHKSKVQDIENRINDWESKISESSALKDSKKLAGELYELISIKKELIIIQDSTKFISKHYFDHEQNGYKGYLSNFCDIQCRRLKFIAEHLQENNQTQWNLMKVNIELYTKVTTDLILMQIAELQKICGTENDSMFQRLDIIKLLVSKAKT